MIADLIAGLLSGFALIAAIGAQNTFVLSQGIRRRHVLPIVLVCAGADALLIVAGIGGLGALIESMPAVLQIARYGGALFLFAYGLLAAWRALQPHRLQIGAQARLSLRGAVATCLGLTFLNPHVYLDTVILLGSLANQRPVTGRWLFGAGAVTASLVWFSALAYGARWLEPWFRQPVAWRILDSLVALTMLGLAAALLWR